MRPKRVVVKLGTAMLGEIKGISAQLAALHAGGTEVIIVSSGAIGLGMGVLGLARRPKELSQKQACAAIGQSLLMQKWQDSFAPHRLAVAQALLTHEDLRAGSRSQGVKETLRQIAAYGAIPVINENDTVSAAEIKIGENDTLSAMVACLVEADYLIILSTAPGLVDRRGSGKILPVVEKITPAIEAMADGTTSETAVGGMLTKISAAKLAVRSGCGVFIASGAEPDIVPRLFAGTGPGTFFVPHGRVLL
jgi:glutamate 5-kinase